MNKYQPSLIEKSFLNLKDRYTTHNHPLDLISNATVINLTVKGSQPPLKMSGCQIINLKIHLESYFYIFYLLGGGGGTYIILETPPHLLSLTQFDQSFNNYIIIIVVVPSLLWPYSSQRRIPGCWFFISKIEVSLSPYTLLTLPQTLSSMTIYTYIYCATLQPTHNPFLIHP